MQLRGRYIVGQGQILCRSRRDRVNNDKICYVEPFLVVIPAKEGIT
jgi:hypothetical protein